MKRQIKVARGGVEIGTYSIRSFEVGLSKGEFGKDDHYWEQGMSSWGRVGDLAKTLQRLDASRLRAELSFLGFPSNSWDEEQLHMERMIATSTEANMRGAPAWKKEDWEFCMYDLHPDLFGDDYGIGRKRFFEEIVPEKLHAYHRGQLVGNSEKLTKARIREVIGRMDVDCPGWYTGRDRKELFMKWLSTYYPKCCDGSPPKRPNGRKDDDERKVSAPTQTGGVQGTANPVAQGTGCVLVLLGFLSLGLILRFTL